MEMNRTFHPENSSADADFGLRSSLSRELVQSLTRGLHRLALALSIGLPVGGVVSNLVKYGGTDICALKV